MENEKLDAQVAEQPKKKSDFWVRLGVGIAYMGILIIFFLLKLFINDYLFDFVVLAFSVLGTLEMLRVFKDKLHVSQKVLVMVFSIATLLTFSISDFMFIRVLHKALGDSNYTPLITLVVFIAGLSAILGLLVFAHDKVTLESTGYALTAYVYPSIFLLIVAGCNHLRFYSAAAILFIFLICPFSDSLALVFGRLFGRRLPRKMAPHVSPNKTLIGGFGGLVGGIIGSIAVFFIYYTVCVPLMPSYDIVIGWAPRSLLNFYDVDWSKFKYIKDIINWGNFIYFLGIGVISSFFSQFGDLVESAIKRKLGVKDMGKMLPGHGGILDRIDSSLYAGLVICLIFTILIMVRL